MCAARPPRAYATRIAPAPHARPLLYRGADASKIEFARTSLSPDDFAFRSGYFYRLSKMAGKRTTPDGRKVDIPDGTPLHTEYLEYAAELGLISQATLDDVVPPA